MFRREKMKPCVAAVGFLYSLWFCSQSLGFATTLKLSDRRGLSIDASETPVEQTRDVSNETSRPYTPTATYREQVYISTTGKVFERLGFSNENTYGQFDAVAANDTEQLRFDENFGFPTI
jgi:hypothetical protein